MSLLDAPAFTHLPLVVRGRAEEMRVSRTVITSHIAGVERERLEP